MFSKLKRNTRVYTLYLICVEKQLMKIEQDINPNICKNRGSKYSRVEIDSSNF